MNITVRFPVWVALAFGLVPITNARAQTPTTIVYRITASADAVLAVDPKPRIDLGESGAAEEIFHRIIAVRQQSSGRIVVANRNPVEMRVFDGNGRYIRTIGRKGQGPGEYQDISDVAVRRGDSLVVLDRDQRRFTLLGPDGSVATTLGFQPPFPTSPYDVTINPLDDGTLLIGYGLVTTRKPSPVPVVVPQVVGRYAPSGARLDSVGMFFTGENFLQAAPPTMGGFAFWDLAFGRKGAIISTGNSFLAGDASAMEVRRFSPKGALLEVHRVDMLPKRITPADIESYKAMSMKGVPQGEREVAQKRVDEMPYPAQFPAYHRFMVDGRGRVWLHEYALPGTQTRWIVMDPKTRQAKAVRLPERFVPFEITATDVLGVWRDSDDVEHVRVYRLVD